MELVCVRFEYEYAGRDGRLVSIKPNESYILLAKTNQYWWHVCKDQHSRPFYVPAQYVTELPSCTKASDTGVEREADIQLGNVMDGCLGARIETQRLSTSSLCDGPPDMELCETQLLKEDSTAPNPAPTDADTIQNLYAKPHHLVKVRHGETKTKTKPPKNVDDEKAFLVDEDFPLPPDLPIYETIPEPSPPDVIIIPPEPPGPAAINDASYVQRLNHLYTLDDQV